MPQATTVRQLVVPAIAEAKATDDAAQCHHDEDF